MHIGWVVDTVVDTELLLLLRTLCFQCGASPVASLSIPLQNMHSQYALEVCTTFVGLGTGLGQPIRLSVEPDRYENPTWAQNCPTTEL